MKGENIILIAALAGTYFGVVKAPEEDVATRNPITNEIMKLTNVLLYTGIGYIASQLVSKQVN